MLDCVHVKCDHLSISLESYDGSCSLVKSLYSDAIRLSLFYAFFFKFLFVITYSTYRKTFLCSKEMLTFLQCCENEVTCLVSALHLAN